MTTFATRFLNSLSSSKIHEHPFILSILLNGVFFSLYLCLGEWRFGSLDDFFMSSVLVGAYGGQYDVHLYFVNAVYGYLLKPLYALFPSVGWYSLGESFEVFASFCVIVYCILTSAKGMWRYILSFLILCCVEPVIWPNIGFTQCAAILTATGILLVGQGILQEKKKLSFVAMIFLIAGFVMRKEMFLLGVPTLGVTILFCIFKTKKDCSKHLIILFFGALAIVGLHCFDKSLYKTDGYDYYVAYQGPRAFFGDGGFYDSEAAYDELKERDMCAGDLRVLRAWYYYDKEAFALDSLRKIMEVVSRSDYEVNYLKMPLAVLIAMSHAFVESHVWCWLLLCLAFVWYSKSWLRYLPWLSLGLVAMSYTYMLMVNRVAGHVEVGGWLYALVVLFPFVDDDNVSFPKGKNLFSCSLLIFAAGCMAVRIYFAIPDICSRGLVGLQNQSSKWVDFEMYAQNHPNEAFFLPFEVYKMYAVHYTRPHVSIKPGSWNNIFPLGYWNMNLPAIERELQKRGVANPMVDITRENAYVLEEKMPILPYYFKEHYKKEIAADTITKFGDLLLLKYRTEDDNEVF